MMRTGRARVAAAVVAVAALGGCAGDEGPRGVLTEDDVENVRVATDSGDDWGVPSCGRLGAAELRVGLGNDAPEQHRRLTLDSGDIVGSSATEVSPRYEDAEEALVAVAATLEECISTPADARTTITRLPGLGDGVVGYRSTLETSTRRTVLERVLAPGGARVVTLSVLHRGAGEPSVDVRDLLPTALERVDELD